MSTKHPPSANIFYILKWKQNPEIEDIIDALKRMKHIPEVRPCPSSSCRDDMVVHKDISRKDHFRWVCRTCRKRKPIRVNTWSEKYRIPFLKLYFLIRFYVENVPDSVAAHKTSLNLDKVRGFYKDLSSLEPHYVTKMTKILNECDEGPQLLSRYERGSLGFRALSNVFTYSSIYNIVLDTLKEYSFKNN